MYLIKLNSSPSQSFGILSFKLYLETGLVDQGAVPLVMPSEWKSFGGAYMLTVLDQSMKIVHLGDSLLYDFSSSSKASCMDSLLLPCNQSSFSTLIDQVLRAAFMLCVPFIIHCTKSYIVDVVLGTLE